MIISAYPEPDKADTLTSSSFLFRILKLVCEYAVSGGNKADTSGFVV
jgi:hypothetical protein